MPLILVEGAILKCPHSGVVTLAGGKPALSVSGKGAIVSWNSNSLTFAGCVQVDASSKSSPCQLLTAVTQGESTKLSIGGVAVLLATASGLATNPAAPGATWSVGDSGQQILSADS